jgi:type IV fimbrial biogenesis protein FimT
MRLSPHRVKLLYVGSAWSLLELLIVLSLLAIMASIATPQLYRSWQLQHLSDERQRLIQKIRFARLTSLQKSAKVSVCWAQACGSPEGFLIYLDANQDGLWQDSEISLSQWQINQSVSCSFNRGAQISFNSAGNTAQSGTMVLCVANANASAINKQVLGYALVLSSSGRLREQATPCI